MTPALATNQSMLLNVYPDHDSAEKAVRMLQRNGISLQKLSIVGQEFQTVEKPVGFATTGSLANDGAQVGAWTGGLFGLLMGAAFLIVPGVGPLVILGPIVATLLGGFEGALAGGLLGGLAGALISLGVSKDEAARYESQIKAGKFMVILQGDEIQLQTAKNLLGTSRPETTAVYVQTLLD